jgi:hypothetical protein
MDFAINNTYSGPFEHVGMDGQNAVFSSVQKVGSIDTAQLYLADVLGGIGGAPDVAAQNALEVNTVDWHVDPNGNITGTARFLVVTTHDLVKATLSGRVAPQVAGQNYRVANVNVTFVGGTGPYANCRGTAQVIAKLFDGGLSVGQIIGTLTVP